MEQSDVFRFSFINDRLGTGHIDTVAICEDAKNKENLPQTPPGNRMRIRVKMDAHLVINRSSFDRITSKKPYHGYIQI